MNILELCLSPALGGLELYVYRTAKILSKTDTVLAVIHDSGRLKPYFKKDGLIFRTQKASFPSFPIFAAKNLASIIDANNIGVLHVHWGKDLPLAALSKYFSKKKPKLIYTRQMKMTRSKDDFYHNFIYRQMDLMLTITDHLAHEAKQYLSTQYVHKIERLYYGVDEPSHILDDKARTALRRSLGISDDTFLVGLFGRIEKTKRQHLLVEALKLAKKNKLKMSGLIVGHVMDDTYFRRLNSTVKQLEMAQDVIFKGFVDHPQHWMQACDCVVLSTHEETFGLVLVEAMQVGVAVVGTNRGGVPEIIEHGKTGLLFESDNTEKLYQCLLRLKENPTFRKILAEAGQAKARTSFATETHYRRLRKYMLL